MEVYIPQEASVTTVPARTLPRSIANNIPASRLHGDQSAVFVTPVELRGIGTASLPPGPVRLGVVTSNLTALQLIRRCVLSGEVRYPGPRAEGVLYDGRNSIIAVAGQLFLSVRKKEARDWPPHPPSPAPPEAPPPGSPENLGADDVINVGAGEGEAEHHGKLTDDALHTEASVDRAAAASRDASTMTRPAQIKQEHKQLADSDSEDANNNAVTKSYVTGLAAPTGARRAASQKIENAVSGEATNAAETNESDILSVNANSNTADAKHSAKAELAGGKELPAVAIQTEPTANANANATLSKTDNGCRWDATNIAGLAGESNDSASSRAGSVSAALEKSSCRKRLSFRGTDEERQGATLTMEKRSARVTSSVEVVEVEDAADAKRLRFDLAESTSDDDVIIIDDDEEGVSRAADVVELAEWKTPAKASAGERKASGGGADLKRPAASASSKADSVAASNHPKPDDSDPRVSVVSATEHRCMTQGLATAKLTVSQVGGATGAVPVAESSLAAVAQVSPSIAANAEPLAKTPASERPAGVDVSGRGACPGAGAMPPLVEAELKREERITLLRRRLQGMEDKLGHMINRRR